MHILLIVNSFHFEDEKVNGSKFKQIFDLYQAAGWTVGLVAPCQQKTSTNNVDLPMSKEDSITIQPRVIIDFSWRKWRLSRLARIPIINTLILKIASKSIYNYINTYGEPDIIHAHGTVHAGLIAHGVARQKHIPFIITEHMSILPTNSLPIGLTTKAINALKESAVITPVSQYVKNKLVKHYDVPEENIKVIPNTVDSLFFLPKEKKPSMEKQEIFRFLSISRLSPIKNFSLLVEAFYQLTNSQPEIKIELYIGGDGPEAPHLSNLIQQFHLEKQVKLLGKLTRQQVLSHLQNCSCYVLSSNTETFGIPLIEAISCGKPVLSTDCGGPSDIISKSNGHIVLKQSPKELSEGMLYMIENSNKFDNKHIREDCINRFGADIYIKRVTEIYQSVLSN